MSESKVYIWGRRAVLEALRAGSARSILISSGRKPAPILAEISRVARDRGVPVREVPPHEVDRRAPGHNTQGVVAEVVERRLDGVDALLRTIPASDRPFLLLLDQLQDPQNVGSLLRTADAAGVHGVVLPSRRSASVAGTVAKVSAGGVSHVPSVEVTNLARAMDKVKAAGIWTVGLVAEAPQEIFAADLRVPTALVVGGEETGLRRLTREKCDLLVRLPMHGTVESLNAAVAGAIGMYEVVRQRRGAGA